MVDYSEDFYNLLHRADVAESTDQLISRYIGGLRTTFQDTLNLLVPATLSEAHQRALLLEKQSQRCLTSGARNTFEQRRHNVNTGSSRLVGDTNTRPPIPPLPASTTRPNRCYTCGERGHFQSTCPRRSGNRTLFVEEEQGLIYDGPPVYDTEPPHVPIEEELHGDIGHFLVVRRTCLSPRNDDDDHSK